MDNKFYTVKQINRANRRAKVRDWTRAKFYRMARWCSDNRQIILVLGPAVLAATTTTMTAIGRHVRLNKTKDLKDLYCYDPSLGHYWRLRRKLTNAEWVSIDKRKAAGERLADILSELKVLK